MNKKSLTLHGINDLWKRTGRRPIETTLITQEMIDEVTAQPLDTNPSPVQIPLTVGQRVSSHRWAWGVAASVAGLLVAGTLWITLENKDTTVAMQPVKEQELMVPRMEMPVTKDIEAPQTIAKVQEHIAEKKVEVQTDYTPCTGEEIRHQWQTEQRLDTDLANHGNSGMVCYSGGQIASTCDEETVTAMLLAFL